MGGQKLFVALLELREHGIIAEKIPCGTRAQRYSQHRATFNENGAVLVDKRARYMVTTLNRAPLWIRSPDYGRSNQEESVAHISC